jgi:hypothetical protein
MKTRIQVLSALLLVALVAYAAFRRVHDAPRRQSLASLTQLDSALRSANHAELLNLVVIPAAVRNRTAPEQSEFLVKALNDEISPQGLEALKKAGDYGPLRELFPTEAEAWASQAGVNPDQCVAFKLERHGLQAEVVLVKPSTREAPYRIVRVNNVKQMADTSFLATKK